MVDPREFARCFPSVKNLESESLAAFLSRLDVVEFADSDVIFAAGDVPEAVYLIASGSVLVLHSGARGPSVTLGRIRRGEMVGEMGLVDGGPRSASAVVEQDVVAWRLSQEDYLSLRDAGHPAIGWILGELGRRLSQRVRSVESRISRAREQPDLASTLPAEQARSRRWYNWLWPWS